MAPTLLTHFLNNHEMASESQGTGLHVGEHGTLYHMLSTSPFAKLRLCEIVSPRRRPRDRMRTAYGIEALCRGVLAFRLPFSGDGVTF